MSELPPGWEQARLGDLGDEVRVSVRPDPETTYELYSVPTYPTGKPELLVGSEIGSSKRAVQPGDVLLCKINPRINRVWIVAEPVGVGPQIASPEYLILRTADLRLARYLRWYLQSPGFRRWIELSVEGATGSHTRAKSGPILEQLVPVPPVGEQERIVTAIEEHLSRLDAAEAGMRSAATRLSTMRSSLLEEVTRGDWASRPLGEVLLSLRNGCFVSRPKADPPGLPILRISAVRPLALDPADVRYAPESLDRAAEYEVRAGDLLFTRYSGNPDYVGACAVVPPEGAGMLHPDKLIRGVPDPALALSGWIAMAASASVGRRQIEQRLKTTAGQVGISGSQLKSVPIPLPPLDEQAARHRRWEDGLEAMTRLRSEIESCSARAEGARRAILAAAFSGQLVPQDPDDEPASVLLERIRAERAAAAPAKRTRKAKVS